MLDTVTRINNNISNKTDRRTVLFIFFFLFVCFFFLFLYFVKSETIERFIRASSWISERSSNLFEIVRRDGKTPRVLNR